jgi:hypothetical protein
MPRKTGPDEPGISAPPPLPNADGTSTVTPRKSPAKGSTASRGASDAPPVAVVQGAYYALFRFAAVLLGSDAVFQRSEFADVAKSTAELARRLPMVGIVVRMIEPLLVLVELIDKIERLREGRAAAKARKEQEQSGLRVA